MIEVSTAELRILSNALNEVCHGPNAIEDWEFHARIGARRDEATALLDELGSVDS